MVVFIKGMEYVQLYRACCMLPGQYRRNHFRIFRASRQGDSYWILGFPWEHTHPQHDDSHGKS
jgi:hypothetical protein